MNARISLTSACFLALVLAACGSSTAKSQKDAHTAQPLEYVGQCTPAECDGLPVSEIGCADGSLPTLSCAPGDDGACQVTPECDGGGTGPDGTVSYAPCDESECGPVPEIGCAPDHKLVQSCGSENGGACTWTSTCTPPPSTTPCATPDGCGPMPEIGVICDDGASGTLACMQVGNECHWQPDCS